MFGTLFRPNIHSVFFLQSVLYLKSCMFQVKLIDGRIAVTNAHVGSIGDILTYPIDVDPDLKISKVQLLDAILLELSDNGFSESEESDFWSNFDNP